MMETKDKKGKLISCWSGFGHQNGNTSFAILFAYTINDLFPQKNILLMDMNYKFALLEKMVENKNPKGIDNLLNIYCTDNITKEFLVDCIYNVKKDKKDTNIFNLSASKNRVFNNNNEFSNAINAVIDLALEIFDFVIVDNSSGDAYALNLINKRADIVLNFLTQNKYILDYMQDIKSINRFNKDNYINIINKYDEINGINLDYISRQYKIKNLKKIPRSHEFTFNLNNNSLHKIIEEDFAYKDSIEKLSMEILKDLGYDFTFGNTGLEDRPNDKNIFKNLILKLNLKTSNKA